MLLTSNYTRLLSCTVTMIRSCSCHCLTVLVTLLLNSAGLVCSLLLVVCNGCFEDNFTVYNSVIVICTRFDEGSRVQCALCSVHCRVQSAL